MVGRFLSKLTRRQRLRDLNNPRTPSSLLSLSPSANGGIDNDEIGYNILNTDDNIIDDENENNKFPRQTTTNDGGSFSRTITLPTLIFLSISNSIGTGVYMFTGMASNLYAGPFICVSYLIGAVVCLLSALCFAEFSARIKASSGSSYSFAYYSLGELIAFITGWMIFIGSLASIAANAIAWSSYLDSLTNYTVYNFTINTLHAKWNLSSPFNDHLDLLAIGILTFLFLISFAGLQLTTFFNNIIAALNILILVVISAAGIYYGDVKNLTETPYTNGVNGVVKGASIVMYAYFGFESSTFAIQETKNPSKNVPLSLILSLCIITVLYCGASLSLVLMQPFNKIDMHSSFPTAFIHIEWAHVITSIGPVLSLTGALLISIYSLERIIFAMAKDGLFFKFFSKLHPRTQVPYFATLFSFVITLLLVVLVDIKALNGYVDISGFLTYSIVGTGLLIVRYCVIDEEDDNDDDDDAHRDQNNYDETCLNECCPPTSDASTVTSRLMTDSMYADDENNLLTDSVPPNDSRYHQQPQRLQETTGVVANSFKIDTSLSR